MTEQRRLTILGSTGTIGLNTLDLVSRQRGAFQVEALTAQRNARKLAEQAIVFGAAFVAVADEAAYPELRDALSGRRVEIGVGEEGVAEAARRRSDIVMAAVVGAACLKPVLAAVERGATVALANKESLVCAGDLVMQAVARHGATLLPVDSEHNAIFQVFDAARRARISRLVLTASGGPFRLAGREVMAAATPAQAVAHPNWAMGAKISIDSATMMNKGLELIEAHHLFAMEEERIDILVHPQSIVHSMVEYVDGSMLAQLGCADMRVPISYALAWPDRMETPAERLDLARIGRLTFETPDPERFPALRLARDCLRAGGAAPTVLNAANEVAVDAFLSGRIGFLDIAAAVEQSLADYRLNIPLDTIEAVVAADGEARRLAAASIARGHLSIVA